MTQTTSNQSLNDLRRMQEIASERAYELTQGGHASEGLTPQQLVSEAAIFESLANIIGAVVERDAGTTPRAA